MNLLTQNGYDLLEVISALQKEIRRSDEEKALFWALELVPQYEAYLWRRLTVIVNEDIGIANPLLLMIIPLQGEVFFGFREQGKDGSARLALANAILLMCRSAKSRLANHLQCVVNQERLQQGKHLQIPDYALDKHTARGRRLKRDFDHWLDVGCVLTHPSDQPDPYAERARQLWKSPGFTQTEWGKRYAAGGTGGGKGKSKSSASAGVEHAQGELELEL
jgi:hypothetical protein